MAKTSTTKAAKGPSEPQVQPSKEQKKQAKREARLRLKIELTQRGLQKAERKVTRAKADVDTLIAQLRELNEQLGHNHAPSNKQEVEHDTTEVEQTSQADIVAETILPEQEVEHDTTEAEQTSQAELVTEITLAEQDLPVNEGATIGEEKPLATDTGPALGDESYEDNEAIEELHHASLPPAEGRNDINSNTTSSPADTTTEPTQESAEEVPSSEQHDTSPVSNESEQHDTSPTSNVKEESATDQEESKQTDEQPTPRKRSTRPRTTTRNARKA
jgi:hypothetical protein